MRPGQWGVVGMYVHTVLFPQYMLESKEMRPWRGAELEVSGEDFRRVPEA